jgi:serine/threonine-protein kinase
MSVHAPSSEGRSASVLNAATVHPFVGETLGGTYKVLRVIDEGGMGTVLEAEHTRLHRAVAVKVLAGHRDGDAFALERFHREAEIIGLLHHPHIVSVIDFDVTPEGHPYLVMELLSGETLEALLERLQRSDRLMPLDECVRIVSEAASALAAAHAVDIVHRDLKPGNVFLVSASGHNGFVKLLDFGISKKLAAGGGRPTGNQVLGTPHYMAPEQAAGDRNVDQRADQYALAVIAYEMLCGSPPFDGDDALVVMHRLVNEPVDALAERAPGCCPPEVDAVIRRALAKDPRDRFADVRTFALALRRAAELARTSEPAATIYSAPLPVEVEDPPTSTAAVQLASSTAPVVTTITEARVPPRLLVAATAALLAAAAAGLVVGMQSSESAQASTPAVAAPSVAPSPPPAPTVEEAEAPPLDEAAPVETAQPKAPSRQSRARSFPPPKPTAVQPLPERKLKVPKF